MREKKKKINNKLNDFLDVPREVGSIKPKITIVRVWRNANRKL